jgi:hypothetical protein
MALPATLNGQELTAKDIIRLADEKFNGEETSISEMAMTIVRPTWEHADKLTLFWKTLLIWKKS